MSDSENLYDVLGVAKDASPSDIKKAYRRLAMLHHPDKNPDHRESSAEIFKRVGMAYQTLGDPEKRRQYDAMLLTRDTNRMPTNGYRSESNENRGFHDFSEEQAFNVFHSFFESFDRDFGFMRGFNNFEDSGFTVPSHNHSIWEDMMRDFVDYDSDRHGEGRTSTQPRGYTSRTVRITTVNGVTRKEIVTQDGEGNITKEVYSSHNNDNSPFTGAIGTVRQDGPPALGSAAGSAGAARSAEPPRAPETEQLESAVSRSGITEGEVKSKCTVDPAEMSPAKTEGGTAATARPATDEEERRKEAPAVVGKQKSVPWYSSLISRIFPCFSGGSNVDEEENHEDGRY